MVVSLLVRIAVKQYAKKVVNVFVRFLINAATLKRVNHANLHAKKVISVAAVSLLARRVVSLLVKRHVKTVKQLVNYKCSMFMFIKLTTNKKQIRSIVNTINVIQITILLMIYWKIIFMIIIHFTIMVISIKFAQNVVIGML